MTKIRFDRLKRVADYLARKKPSPSFSMLGWALPSVAHDNHCGFAGCAMGWVAHRKMFRGFKLEARWHGATAIPIYHGAENFKAVAELFGITKDQARNLFGPKKRTPKQVAATIRNFIRDYKAKVAA